MKFFSVPMLSIFNMVKYFSTAYSFGGRNSFTQKDFLDLDKLRNY